MADQAELVFVRAFIKTIANHPVTFPDDYQQPLHDWAKKVPILPIELPPVPERKGEPSAPAPAARINITFKSLKPPQSFTLSVQSTDTISDIKSQLASQPRAPPADAQRLLLKGKALADSKLLKEYNVKDGDTINLMTKPGFDWDPAMASFPSSPEPKTLLDPDMKSPPSIDSLPKLTTGFKHTRTPSIVLSPSPSVISLEPEGKPQDINLTLDTSSIPTVSLSPATRSSYQTVVCEPEFWDRLLAFLRTEFTSENDALIAFEDFLRASKGAMTASEIAKIRDHVGVVGMAGT